MSIEKNQMEEGEKWAGIVRANLISANTQKFFNYISLVDQKANGLIFLNSIIIPIILSRVDVEDFRYAAIISIIACAASMFAAMICIFPKRRALGKPDGTINPLHFSDVARLSEEEYLAHMTPIYNDPPTLGKVAIKDLHDVASHILRPKFFWLKSSYLIFFFGNLLAIAVEFYYLWGVSN